MLCHELESPVIADVLPDLQAEVDALAPCPHRAVTKACLDLKTGQYVPSPFCAIAAPAAMLRFTFGGTKTCQQCCASTKPRDITNEVLAGRIASRQKTRIERYHAAPARHVYGRLEEAVRTVARREGLVTVQGCLLKARATGMTVVRAAALEAEARDELELAAE